MVYKTEAPREVRGRGGEVRGKEGIRLEFGKEQCLQF